jgi:hypothetical protein
VPAETVRVRGLREFIRASDHAGPDAKKEVRAAFREAGEIVRQEAAQRFASIDARSAAGYRVSVRQRGVSVVQSLRKTTGTRPDYGALQMRRALVPALTAKEQQVERAVEKALDRVADHFDNPF